MKTSTEFVSLFLILTIILSVSNANKSESASQTTIKRHIFIEWENGRPQGYLEILNGKLVNLRITKGQILKLLPGIHRAWLENGKKIELDNVVSYFDNLSLYIESRLDKGYVDAVVECTSFRRPQRIVLRLPHPNGQKPLRVTKGIYDSLTETIRIEPFQGSAHAKVDF